MSIIYRFLLKAVVLAYLSIHPFVNVYAATSYGNDDAPSRNKGWTILIFLNADNNLEKAGYDDMQEMEKVGSTDDINIVVQFDGLSPQGTKRVLVKKNPSTVPPTVRKSFFSPVVEEMSEQDMGNTETFKSFVEWGMKTYPAKHYFVIMWNHGAGWSKETDSDSMFRSISYDDTSGKHISTNELSQAFDDIVSDTGNKIDVLGFDACLMAMYEVVDSLTGMVDYVVASQETEPGDGYPYDDFLKLFGSRRDKTPEQLTLDLVEVYGKSYSGGSQGKQPVTNSAIDLSKFELIKRRLDRWVQIVSARGMEIKREKFLSAAKDTVKYYNSDFRDLGHYVKRVLQTVVEEESMASATTSAIVSGRSLPRAGDGILGASMSLLKAIDDAVIANFNSTKYANSTGLSIYLPYGYNGKGEWSSTRSKRRDNYLDLKWSNTTEWSYHLDSIFPDE